MMDPRQAQPITPATANVMGQNVEIMADIDPEQFPQGLELLLFKPGTIEPIGRGMVRKGCMIGIVPPDMANQIRTMMRKMVEQQRANGPGLG